MSKFHGTDEVAGDSSLLIIKLVEMLQSLEIYTKEIIGKL